MEYQKKIINIKGLETYQCDTNGVIYGKNGNPLKPNINHKGYYYVSLILDGKLKSFSVHRLIALTFIPNNDTTKDVVNHIDGNKLNNNIINLEWTNCKGNTLHARDVLHCNFGEVNKKPIIGIDRNTNETIYCFDSLSDAARFFAQDKKGYRGIKTSIWKALVHYKHCHSYRGCYWEYDIK